MLKKPFNLLTEEEVNTMNRGLGDDLGKALRDAEQAPPWAGDIAKEYDRGPQDRLDRAMLIQSLFDRM